MNQAMKEIRKSCQDNVNQLGQTYRAMYDEIEKKLRRNVHAGEAQERRRRVRYWIFQACYWKQRRLV